MFLIFSLTSLAVFDDFQLMAKHAIDYNVFGGPQNFGKWMDVHSAPSCPAEVIKDFYFVFRNCFSLSFLIYLYGCFVLFVLAHVTLIWLVT